MKSINQVYAATALQCVEAVQKINEKKRNQYGSHCHRFPQMVLLNGLNLTVAFYSRDKNMRTTFLKDILRAVGIEKWEPIKDMSDYRTATNKILEASVWFKRYAEAILGVTQADSTDIEEEVES